jgi:phosphatidylglycerol phospholipase C
VLITWFLPYARHFLRLPSLGYNVFQRALVGPLGAHFLRRARADDRLVFAWTVNEERWMEWCLRRNVDEVSDQQRQQQGEKLIDGVITDDPKLFLEVCARWEDEQDGKVVRAARSSGVVGGLRGGLRVVMQLLVFQVIAPLFYFHRRFIAGKLDLLTGDDSIERVVDEAKVKAS